MAGPRAGQTSPQDRGEGFSKSAAVGTLPVAGWAVLGEGSWRTAVARGGLASAVARNPPKDPSRRFPQPLAPRPSRGDRRLLSHCTPPSGARRAGREPLCGQANPSQPPPPRCRENRRGSGHPAAVSALLRARRGVRGVQGVRDREGLRDSLVWGRLVPGGMSVLGGAEGGSVLRVPATGARPRPRPLVASFVGPPGGPGVPKHGEGQQPGPLPVLLTAPHQCLPSAPRASSGPAGPSLTPASSAAP